MLRTHAATVMVAIALAAAILFAFGGALRLGFAPIDDHHLIVRNLAVRGTPAQSIQRLFAGYDPELYIPVTLLSFRLEYSLAGLRPWVFHVDNLLLHFLNALLVAAIAARLARSKAAAACCAFLFAVLPVHTETVVWISARKDLLAAFFALFTVLFFLRWIESGKKAWWAMAIAAFALGCLSKIAIVLLPLILVFLFLRERPAPKRTLAATTPFFLISLLLGVVALFGKTTVLGSSSIVVRVLLAAYAMGSALIHILLPLHLGVFYPLPSLHPIAPATAAIALVPLLLLIASLAVRKEAPLASLGIAWFLVAIAPTVLNIQTDLHAAGATFAADRYAYFPSIGILLALIGCATPLRRWWSASALRQAGIGITAIAVILSVPLARAQTGTWQSTATLYTHVLSFAPAAAQARVALARDLRAQNRTQEAFDLLRDGLAYADDPRLHLEAGFLLASTGQVSQAEEQFRLVEAKDPRNAEAAYGLAGLRAHAGDTLEAQRLYREALQREPRYPQALLELASLLRAKGDLAGAEEQLRAAVAADDGDPQTLLALADLWEVEGKKTEAERYRKEAALLESNE